MDGKLPTAFLADEAGAMDSYPVEAMRSGQITLVNSLGIVISTEYPNDNNVMIDEVDKGKKVLDGLRDDRRMFSLIYVPDDYLWQGDTWMHDDLCIYQSNPKIISVSTTTLNIKALVLRDISKLPRYEKGKGKKTMHGGKEERYGLDLIFP